MNYDVMAYPPSHDDLPEHIMGVSIPSPPAGTIYSLHPATHPLRPTTGWDGTGTADPTVAGINKWKLHFCNFFYQSLLRRANSRLVTHSALLMVGA